MSEKCFKINELTVPGSRQDERLTTGLDPGHVRADERGIEALMVFINRYAGLLNFFEWQGDGQQEYIVNGNWQPLIQSNEAFHYAGLAITPAHLPNVTFYKWSDRYEKGSDRQHRFAAWRVMWDLLFSLYRDIDGFYDALPTGMPLRNVVASEIVNHLSAGMMNATARYLNAAEPQMIPEILPKGAAPDPSKYVLFQSTSADDDVYNFGYADELITNGFNHIWIYPASGKDNWADYYDLLWNMNAETDYKAEDGFIPDFFGDDGLLGFDRIDYATLHIRRLFENAFGAYTRIIKAAADHLQQSLTNKHDHQAHHALLLAFLKIFGRLQDQLNEFTRKHLEFYYDKVLQMKPAAAAADAVHVWAQPAKGVDHYLLKKGTRLQAGKDAGGKPLFYDTTDDLTLSQAEVAEMKTIYLEPVPGSNLVQKVFASPVARSADGKGLEPIPDTWKVFGDERKDPLTNLSVNSASVGFCISAPVLHLTQGKRIIELTFSTNADGHAKTEGWTDEGLHELLYISFSTAQGWAALELTAATFTFSRPEANKFCFTITLPVDFPAVTGYDAAATADGLPSTFPSIRVLLQQDNGLEYESFKDIFLNEIGIKVTVSDMLSIAVQGGQGVLDPSSPFQPFGPVPGVGAAFYVGHPEIGYKKITEVTLKLQWEDYIDDLKAYYNYIKAGTTDNYISIASNNSFKVGWALLRNKTWIPLDTSRDLFSSASTTYCKTVLNIPDASLGATSFNEALAAWNTQARDGFIRIVLTEPSAAFGHKIWPALFAKQSIANNPPDFTKNSLPDPPYVPVVNGISLGYTADQTIELNGAKSERGYFFHHEPFGYRMVTAHGLLLPAFGGEIKNEDGTLETGVGESFWFIGISGARAMAQVSLLLQMSEGSEDISIDTPKVYWNYLSKDGWKHFGDHWQADDTDGLLRSGIVRFIVPQDATFESTELASGMFWIKAWVKENSGGIPNAVAVHANAVKALLQGQPHPSHFQQALAAGEVKRLFLPDAAIKKVHQPFPSFGGKPAGSGIGFYTRVSERLRHKNRAVTIWDYERLVLQEFPEVYKVKCLNHTGYACSKEDELPGYRENLPGQVMLVPLPFANRVQTADIFQPVFSASMLSRIKAYIRGDDAASSCKPFTKALHTRLAKLHVENPKYETITVTCSIRVKDCLDPFVHRERLHEDLNLLLSPWISGGTSALRFGGSLHVSILVYFMEQLSYIDHVEQVAMVQSYAGESTALNISDPDTARATTSRSVLTSSNAHIINLLDI